MEQAVLFRAAAIIGAVCGIWLLRAAWRLKKLNGPRLLSGWALIFASFVVWAQTTGTDKGTALGIVCITLVALAFLGSTALRASVREERQRQERIAPSVTLGWLAIAHRVFAGLLIGPLSGLSALALSAAAFVVFHDIGWEHTANLITAMFAFPLIWAGLAVVSGVDSFLWRKSLVVLGLGLAPLAYLMAAH